MAQYVFLSDYILMINPKKFIFIPKILDSKEIWFCLYFPC